MQELSIGGQVIKPGQSIRLQIPVAKLYTDTDMNIPVQVVRGKKDGPVIFISSAIHGDELNGIEIIRRLIKTKSLKISRGTVIFVPIVNIYGVINQSRYLPDRRDLNRSFPGSSKGSLASRLANKFIEEIVEKCDYGIDLHTGSLNRSNLPQIRADLSDSETLELAKAFGVPVLINSTLRDGSLRQAAVEMDTKVLLYEAGEALRFDELSIRAGIKGVINILSHLGMLNTRRRKTSIAPFVANTSAWVRANASGTINCHKNLGDQVEKGEILANISTPFGDLLGEVNATRSGIIIGKQNIPMVQEGEAIFHIAFFTESDDEIVENIESFQEAIGIE